MKKHLDFLPSEASLSSCQFSGASDSRNACNLDKCYQPGQPQVLHLNLASTRRLKGRNLITVAASGLSTCLPHPWSYSLKRYSSSQRLWNSKSSQEPPFLGARCRHLDTVNPCTTQVHCVGLLTFFLNFSKSSTYSACLSCLPFYLLHVFHLWHT